MSNEGGSVVRRGVFANIGWLGRRRSVRRPREHGACNERSGDGAHVASGPATATWAACEAARVATLRNAGAARPTREQFLVGPYQVQHLPTGAKFGAYPGQADLCYISWGRLNERRTAADYRDELRRIAGELLRERSKY